MSFEQHNRKLKLLDVFCGLGGVSDGFALEGFDVTGIDIEDMPSKGYKHRFIQADIHNLKGEDYRGYDVVWGSPPCRDFSNWVHGAVCNRNGKIWKWKDPPNLERSLGVVKTFINFCIYAKPQFWIMENVKGLAKHLNMKPRAVGSRIKGGKSHVFYGNFPSLLIPQTESIQMDRIQGKLRAWERAKIPLACSRAFACACKEALQEAYV